MFKLGFGEINVLNVKKILKKHLSWEKKFGGKQGGKQGNCFPGKQGNRETAVPKIRGKQGNRETAILTIGGKQGNRETRIFLKILNTEAHERFERLRVFHAQPFLPFSCISFKKTYAGRGAQLLLKTGHKCPAYLNIFSVTGRLLMVKKVFWGKGGFQKSVNKDSRTATR